MSVFCVNRSSTEFREQSKRMNIHPNSLEVCVHHFLNSQYAKNHLAATDEIAYPSDEYVYEYFHKGNNTSGKKALAAWAKVIGKSHFGETYHYADQQPYIDERVAKALEIVPQEGIHQYWNNEGKKVLHIDRPIIKNAEELEYLLDKLGLIHKWNNGYYLTKTTNTGIAGRHDRNITFLEERLNDALNILGIPTGTVTLSPTTNAWQVTVNPSYSDFKATSVATEGLLFQKPIQTQLSILKSYNQPLEGRGSLKNIKEYINQMKGLDPLIKNVLNRALEQDISLASLTPLQLFNVISKQFERDMAAEYNKYILEPVNHKLEEHLLEYLKPFNITAIEDGLAEQYGVTGIFDILNKTIHLAKERNAVTVSEEFAHAFVELMGSKVSNRPENADFKFLMDNIESTSIYKQVYENYKDTYVKDGKPDEYKIKKEAIGQALAAAINGQWESNHDEKETSFWTKLKKWFTDILNHFSNTDYINIDSLLNKIANEVINNDYSRLKKVNSEGFKLLDYADTIATQNKKDGGKALNFMKYFTEKGNIITGSLSYRKQGTVYRGAMDALHDIDMKVPASTHGVDMNSPVIRGIISRLKRKDPALVEAMKTTPYFKQILADYPNMTLLAGYPGANDSIVINAIYTDNPELAERFANLSGSYAKRLESFTPEEIDQMYLFDFFLEKDDSAFVMDTENGLRLSDWLESFKAKLEMGRAKDIYDYQMWEAFDDYKAEMMAPEEWLMFLQPTPVSRDKFNTEQKLALADVSNYILDPNSPLEFWTLSGKAGTGKTTIVNEIIKEVQAKQPLLRVTVSAVANKAVEVLNGKIEGSHASGSTAAVLGLKETEKNGGIVWTRPKPKPGEPAVVGFPEKYDCDILIVDEASMLNEDLIKFIKEAQDVKGGDLKIIYIGDEGQAPAIRETDSKVAADTLSPVFTMPNGGKSVLKTIVRQGKASPIIEFSSILWDNTVTGPIPTTGQKIKAYPTQQVTDTGALLLYKDADIKQMALPLIQEALATKNPNLFKIVAVHRNVVPMYNEEIYRLLYPTESKESMPIHVNDLIMFYAPLKTAVLKRNAKDPSDTITINNSSEYVVEKVSTPTTFNTRNMIEYLRSLTTEFNMIPVKDLDIQTITMKVKDEENFVTMDVPVIVPTYENQQFLNNLRNALFLLTVRTLDKSKRAKLIEYRNVLDTIGNVQFNFAINVHKSQGSTYDTVLVDAEDIFGNRPGRDGKVSKGFSGIARQKLLYTGITRAANVTAVVWDKFGGSAKTTDLLSINEHINKVKGIVTPKKEESSTPILDKVHEVATDMNANMKAVSEQWDKIFEDFNSHNEKIDTDTEHAYYYYPNGKEHPETKELVPTSVTTLVNPEKVTNGWFKVATKIGSAADAIVRDFFNGIDITTRTYPNFTLDQVRLLKDQLSQLRTYFKNKFGNKQFRIITNEIPLIGKYVGPGGALLMVGGTMDMLIIDEDGNYYIYDVKTTRHDINKSPNKKYHYSSQVNFYREILEANRPELRGKCKGMGLILLATGYLTPKGETANRLPGVTNYTFESNGQIMANGQPIQTYRDRSFQGYTAPHMFDNKVERSVIEDIEMREPTTSIVTGYDDEARTNIEEHESIIVKPIKETVEDREDPALDIQPQINLDLTSLHVEEYNDRYRPMPVTLAPAVFQSAQQALIKGGFNVELYWKSSKDGATTNPALLISLPKMKNKGFFELVADREDLGNDTYGDYNNEYSVHFKTKSAKANNSTDTATEPLTAKEKEYLFDALIWAIPIGGKVSTWGSLSKGGIHALETLGAKDKNHLLKKVGERTVTSKETGGSITIPIYEKLNISTEELKETPKADTLYMYKDGDTTFGAHTLQYGPIEERNGKPIGMRTLYNGTILVDKEAMHTKWETKAWKTPDTSDAIGIDFESESDMMTWSLLHEVAHEVLKHNENPGLARDRENAANAWATVEFNKLKSRRTEAIVQISSVPYKKADPSNDPNTAYIFTENALASEALYPTLDETRKTWPLPTTLSLNVRDMSETAHPNTAGIRLSEKGEVRPNVFGIVVKKYQLNKEGIFVSLEGTFADTDEDFKIFTDLNEAVFLRLDKSGLKKITFPSLMALGRAALPVRFAEWLRDQLFTRYGIITELLDNSRKDYKGVGLKLVKIDASPLSYIQPLVLVATKDATLTAAKIGGINTLRSSAHPNQHFGNPFSVKGYTGVLKVLPTVDEAVKAFEAWLRGTAYQEIEPERRAWILDKLNGGMLDNKPLVYYTDKVDARPGLDYFGNPAEGGVMKYDYVTAPNHAHILQKLIYEHQTTKLPIGIVKKENPKVINIYAGTGENADLSNFAIRPINTLELFSGEYEDWEKWQQHVSDTLSENTYNTVEGAFQAAKLAYTKEYFKEGSNYFLSDEGIKLLHDLETASGPQARALGRRIKGLNTESWDKDSSKIMKALLKASFEQNPQALQRLLATGDAILTHTLDKGKWGTEFPKLLMEVREELKPQAVTPQVRTFTNFSGGAYGADTLWDLVGREYGIDKHFHIIPKGLTTPTSRTLKELKITGYDLTPEQEKEASAFFASMGTPTTDDFVLRDYWLAKSADAIFAIAPVLAHADRYHAYVKGGTDHAVAVGIALKKPVYVWDMNTKTWKVWDATNKKFVECSETPILPLNFAGVGTRTLENYPKKAKDGTWSTTKALGEYVGDEMREAARQAIEAVYQKTLLNAETTKLEVGAKVVLTTINTLESNNSELSTEEKKSIKEILGDTKPRVLIASEASDPVFHAAKIKNLVEEELKKPASERSFHMMYLITKHDGLPFRSLAELNIPKFYHFSITSLGGTLYEPGVMKYNDLLDRIESFIKEGLINPALVTVRIDPIIPGVTTLEDIETIISRSKAMGINKIKFSIMDSYGSSENGGADSSKRDRYIVLKMTALGYDWDKFYGRDANGYVNFNAKLVIQRSIYTEMDKLAGKYGVHMTTCAEKPLGIDLKHIRTDQGCVNVQAMNAAMGTNDIAHVSGHQRPTCNCFGNKVDALNYDDNTCASSCVYCYAKHNSDSVMKYYNNDGTLKNNAFTLVSPNLDPDAEKRQKEYEEAENRRLTQLLAQKEALSAKPFDPTKAYTPSELALIKATRDLNAAAATLFRPTELKNLSKLCMFQVSDLISLLLSDKEAAKRIFPENSPFYNRDFTGMDRIDLIYEVKMENLLAAVRDLYFSGVGVDLSRKMRKKLAAIHDNWVAFVLMGYSALADLEQVAVNSYTLKPNGLGTSLRTVVVNDDSTEVVDADTAAEIAELTGSAIEHWLINISGVSAFSSLSQMLKRYVNSIKQVDYMGNDITNEFQIPLRVDAGKAVANILMWTQGALNLEDMAIRLEQHITEEPWLQLVVDDLRGDDENFKALFYSNFKKYFLPYMIQYVDKKTGNLVHKVINNSLLEEQMIDDYQSNWQNRKEGTLSLYTLDGTINSVVLKSLLNASTVIAKTLDAENPEITQEVKDALRDIYKAFDIELSEEQLEGIATLLDLKDLRSPVYYITQALERAHKANKDDYSLLDDSKGQRKNLKTLFSKVTDASNINMESVSMEAGKLHYSYIVPSYLSKMFGKIQGNVADYDAYMEKEYGKYNWFKKDGQWRNEWLRRLNEEDGVDRAQFKHAVILSSETKKGSSLGYTEKSPVLYERSMLLNYFAEDQRTPTGVRYGLYAWFRIPIMSNKPSEEYIHFIKFTGLRWKEDLIECIKEVVSLEIDRIATVEQRNLDKNDPRFIKNFDKNGRSFQFIEYLLDYLSAYDNWAKDHPDNSLDTIRSMKDDRLLLGKYLRILIDNAKTNTAPNDLIASNRAEYNTLLEQAINKGMDARFLEYRNTLLKEGVIVRKNNALNYDNLKDLNMGSTVDEIESSLENFFWNDAFAAILILLLTVTDTAYYKDTEDLQKRLALIHAPGLRGNLEAKDRYNNKVSDGIERTVYLKDFEGVVSDAIENVKEILNARYAAMPETNEVERQAKETYKNTIDDLVKSLKGSFKDINVTDAQGYSSFSSYRKKAIMFGKWSDNFEDTWQRAVDKISSGKYTERDLLMAIQPLKPFVYSQTSKDTTGPLETMKVGVQNKNSEYMLMMMDAILRGEKKSGDCKLRAIFEIMEESYQIRTEGDHKVAAVDGIDTILFESTVKAGLQGAIDISDKGINKWKAAHPDAKLTNTEIVKLILREAIYTDGKVGSGYRQEYVHELDFEDYCIQSEVPAHMEGESIFGSLLRILGIADMPLYDAQGNPTMITINGKTMTVKEAKEAYMMAIVENILDSMDTLIEELHLDGTQEEKNVALSRLLQEQIKKDNRDGYDLLFAVSTDERGHFNMPISDPIQAGRIQLLLNSIIKSRINKQLMKGGPVVQVTNFGTGDSLQIVFQDKNGHKLPTFKEFFTKNYVAPENGKKYTFSEFINLSRFENSTKAEEKAIYNTVYKPLMEQYQALIKDNQGSIAYFECYAPSTVFAEEYPEAVDKHGNVTIEYFQKNCPEVLELIGYRIPTEAKYSMAPLRIVGFLPHEAGEGIMLPKDITLLSGSDFDIDKLYLVRPEVVRSFNKKEAKKLFTKLQGKTYNTEEIWNDIYETFPEISEALEARRDAAYNSWLSEGNSGSLEDFLKEVKKPRKLDWFTSKKESADTFNMFLEKYGDTEYILVDGIKLTWREWWKEHMWDRDDSGKPKYIVYEKASDTNTRFGRNNVIFDTIYGVLTSPLAADQIFTPGNFDEPKKYGYMAAVLETISNEKLISAAAKVKDASVQKIIADYVKDYNTAVNTLVIDSLDLIKIMFSRDSNFENLDSIAEQSEIEALGQKVSSGDFTEEDEKLLRAKYWQYRDLLEKHRVNHAVTKFPKFPTLDRYALADSLDTDSLKDLLATSKNLVYNHTHLQFHKLNMVAGKLIGVFALNNVSHSVISLVDGDKDAEGKDIHPTIVVDEANALLIEDSLILGEVLFDSLSDRRGKRISASLAAFLAASVDAVKDPVLNFMNINLTTAGVLCTMVRMGFDTEMAMLFLSQPIIKKLVLDYNVANENDSVSMGQIIQDLLTANGNAYTDTPRISKDYLKTLTNSRESSYLDNCNLLRTFQNLYAISLATSNIVSLTKFNSVTSAIGPMITDTIGMRLKINKALSDPMLLSISMRRALANPIIVAFRLATLGDRTALGLASEMFEPYFPIALLNFFDVVEKLLSQISADLSSSSNRNILNKLADFYTAYVLNAATDISGEAHPIFKDDTVNPNPLSRERRDYIISNLPKKIKELKKTSKNDLISRLEIKPTDERHTRQWLSINTRGMTGDLKDYVRMAWYELYLEDPVTAMELAEYNFIIDGFGFSPLSFSNIIPMQLRLLVPYYTTNLQLILGIADIDTFLDLFIRNYHNEKALVKQLYDMELVLKKGNRLYVDPDILTGMINIQDNPRLFMKDTSGNLYKYHGTVGKTLVYERTTKLGGENNEILEFNPFGPCESIFTEAEYSSLAASSENTATNRVKTYNLGDQLAYFIATKVDKKDRRDILLKLTAATREGEQELLQTIQDLLELGQCSAAVESFAKDLPTTKRAIAYAAAFILDDKHGRRNVELELTKLINGILNTEQQLLICK